MRRADAVLNFEWAISWYLVSADSLSVFANHPLLNGPVLIR